MPIWPAAAVAIVGVIVFGWRIAPGIALGTILAIRYSLGGSWSFSCCIAVMNTLGPVLGANLINRQIYGKSWLIWSRRNIVVIFLVGIILVPLIAATGGIGSKYMLGLMPFSAVPHAFMRWGLAHALGNLLFTPPLLLWFFKGEKE